MEATVRLGPLRALPRKAAILAGRLACRERRDLSLFDDYSAVVEERKCFQDRGAALSHIDRQHTHKL